MLVRKQRPALLLAALALVFLALHAGCNKTPSNIGQVTGHIKLNDQPLAGALVVFSPVAQGGTQSLGKTDAEGKYELNYHRGVNGAEIGEHLVSITTHDPGSPDADPPVPRVPEMVPLEYNRQTTLKKTVNKGPNIIDFELKSDGRPIRQPR